MVNNLNGYQFYIFCGNRDLTGGILTGIAFDEWTSYNAHTMVWYAGSNGRSEALHQQVEKIQPDVLYIVGIFDWHFNLVPLLFCKVPRKILSARGMLLPGALSQKPLKKKLLLKFLKLFGRHKKILFHATDDAEAGYIQDVFGEQAVVKVAGNFPQLFERNGSGQKQAGALKLISIGIIGPMKNYLLILQALTNCTGTIQYDIYGPIKDMAYWQLCIQCIKTLPSNITVEYHAAIKPTAIYTALSNANVFILPSKSENYGHAIIEALSAGLPVITSKYTPWKSLHESFAGMNVENLVEPITESVQFFTGVSADEYLQWSLGASAYAHSKTDLGALVSAYQKLFS